MDEEKRPPACGLLARACEGEMRCRGGRDATVAPVTAMSGSVLLLRRCCGSWRSNTGLYTQERLSTVSSPQIAKRRTPLRRGVSPPQNTPLATPPSPARKPAYPTFRPGHLLARPRRVVTLQQA